MKIDIWSDVVCPFCYIGKRRFEEALEQYRRRAEVTVEWHSFQLDPNAKAQPGKDIHSYLAQMKGQTREWAVAMHSEVAEMARAVGLQYNFDRVVIANTTKAHRLIQLAKKYGLDDAAQERLFKAYFTEGRDIGSEEVLIELGAEVGLEPVDIRQALSSGEFAAAVDEDVAEANRVGCRGVPFFLIDHKYTVDGAQPAEVFLEVFENAAAASDARLST